jgi:TRAP transporter TAXI family solute receptor
MAHLGQLAPIARRAPTLALALTALLLVTACQAPRAAAPASGSSSASFAGRTLNIVTGGTGGVYIVYGAGLADILSKKMGVAASAQSTPASVANMQLIRDGKADLAFTLADTAYDAFVGRETFTPADKVDARTIAVLYSNYTHIVARDDAGINTVADLRGKRVSMGAAASGTEIIGNRVLEAYGLNPETDIQRERLGVADSASAVKDDKIDAFFWSGGLPTAQITDLVSTNRIKLLDHGDAIQKMADKYGPFYFPAKIPRGTYGNDSDVTVSGVANLLVVPANFDSAFVKAILQTTFDSQPDLATIHAEGRNLQLQTAVEGSPLDFHPGAIDFYREKGVWRR